MKVLVTILQCRRVVIPYLFIKYSLPVLIRAFGEANVDVHIVQHVALENSSSRMATSSYPFEKQLVVESWTKEGKYGQAIITRHDRDNPNYPSLPSWEIGYEYAQKSDADIFVWLEDDAFLYDPYCSDWGSLLKNFLVGFYRDEPHGFIRNAHYVCTREFVELFLPLIKQQDKWDIAQSIYINNNPDSGLNINAPRMEPMITKTVGERKVKLDDTYVVRFPSNQEGKKHFTQVIEAICGKDVKLLEIDFFE